MSFLMTALGVGGTLFFFMKTPQDSVEREALAQNEVKVGGTAPQILPSDVQKPFQGLMHQDQGIFPSPTEGQISSSEKSQRSELLSKLQAAQKPDEKLEIARQLKASGDFKNARGIFKELIQTGEVASLEEVEKEYWDNNIRLLFSNQHVEGWTQEGVVQKGDSVATLAARYHTTTDLLAESNHLKNNLIHKGEKLRVFTGEFSMVVDKSMNTLALKVNGEVIKVYQVSTGVGGSSPVGDFKIINKLVNPPWHHDGKTIPFGDPQNILGTRWMGFNLRGYGLHGTWDTQSLGTQASAGCVRLRNAEVEEVYKMIPVGTQVSIVE